MRTKLFIAFLSVILMALVSNLVFERLIIKDFEEYTMGVEQDRLYWVLASVEGSYTGEQWDRHLLSHPMQWGTMLGYDLVVLDSRGRHVTSSLEALGTITPTMRRRIESLVHVNRPLGDYEEYPLYSGGEEIGFLMARPLESRFELNMKEMMFKERGRTFLIITFLIAGSGAVLLAMLMSQYLTIPLRRLKKASERVADGDLGVRVAPGPRDEVGRLITSFNYMVETLEREETLRRHLTSNIAHELRTPIAVLRSNLEAVSDGLVPCTPDSVKSLEAEVERLTNLVKGIEDFTRTEASLLRPAQTVSLDLGEFTRAIGSSLMKVFEAKGIRLTIDSGSSDDADNANESGPQISVNADAGKLETVLRNLLANAATHTRTGGATLRYGTAGGAGFFIEVADTGPGIAEQDLEHIFKRFFKGRGSEGTGLGLSIAKELVEAMGGSITVRNATKGGAVFRVELPASPTAKT